MIGSSFMDPVLGVDVHFEMVPTPAPVPTPIPNPFLGVVFDPVGLAVGLAIGAAVSAVLGAPMQGPVLYWTAFPATNTGTEAKGVPGHIIIPPGTAWAPFPKTPKPVIHPGEVPKPGLPVKPEDDAVCIFGSKTVTVMGSNAVRLGDIALSCGEPVRLPSSVVMAVPKGAPILVGGPPSLDILAALMASLRTRFISDSMHAALSRLKPSRFRNFMHRAVCFLTGHPVDVASGKVLTECVDFELTGPLPIKLERIYSSAFAARTGPLGHGWSHSLEQAVWRERGRVVLLAEDGREIEFDTFDMADHAIAVGQSVFNPVERLQLHCDKDGWRVVDEHGVTRQFAAVAGRRDGRAVLRRIYTLDGSNAVELTYDEAGRLSWVRESGGRALAMRYDAAGRLTELYAPKPHGEGLVRHRTYAYDERGDLVRVDDSLGQSWRYAYVTHLLTQETDRAGLSFYFVYDGTGEDAWCVRTWGDDGIFDHVLVYDKKNKVTFVTDSRGQTTQYHCNPVGLVTKIVDPRGGETLHEYDSVTLRRTKHVDPNGHTTVMQYDGRGALIQQVDPVGAVVAIQRDDAGRPVAATSAVGATWEWRYDRFGRLIEESAPDSGRRRFLYESGLLAGVIDPRGHNLALGYEDRLPCTVRTGGTVTERLVYDQRGQLVERSDGTDARQRFVRDTEGRLVEAVDADGSRTKVEYDGEGRPLRIVDGNGETVFRYWGPGRLASRTRGGVTVRYHWDTEGGLVGITDGASARYRFILDECGRVVGEEDFMGRAHRYVRDAAGQVLEMHRPSGKRVHYEYDPNGRVVAVDYGDGSETFEYRPDGELVAAANGDRTIELRRDPAGRVLAEVQGSCTVESRYDAAGLRTGFTSSLGGSEGVDYDALGEVSAMRIATPRRSGTEWAFSFQYDAARRETARQLPGGVVIRSDRDSLGRVKRQTAWTSAGTITDLELDWQVGDRLAGIKDASRGRSRFEHDRTGNLSATRLDEGDARLRNPDAVGNVYRAIDRSDRDYGRQGQLLSARGPDGLTRYEYDDDGQLTTVTEPGGGQWRYTWNGAGRLAVVQRPDGKVVELGYDAFGRRVLKKTAEGTTQYYWDGHRMLHEVDESDAVVTWHYDVGSFAPLARVSGDELLGVVADHRGTPLAMVDAEGRTRWEGRVGPDGELEVERGDVACPFRHLGQYWDPELGLSYNRFRYFDPGAGTYISPDPLRAIGGLPVMPYVRHGAFANVDITELSSNTSQYAYVGDPLVWSDPFGLVRIHTEAGVEINAYPGPDVGGKEHLPLHAHVREGRSEVRVLMEDWWDNGRLKGRMGEVYPGDGALSKKARKIVRNNLDDLARKTREVFETGGCS